MSKRLKLGSSKLNCICEILLASRRDPSRVAGTKSGEATKTDYQDLKLVCAARVYTVWDASHADTQKQMTIRCQNESCMARKTRSAVKVAVIAGMVSGASAFVGNFGGIASRSSGISLLGGRSEVSACNPSCACPRGIQLRSVDDSADHRLSFHLCTFLHSHVLTIVKLPKRPSIRLTHCSPDHHLSRTNL